MSYRKVNTIPDFVRAFRAEHGISQATLGAMFIPAKTAGYVNLVEMGKYDLPFSFLKMLYPLLNAQEKALLKQVVANTAINELETPEPPPKRKSKK